MTFADVTRTVNSRIAVVPANQVLVQMHSAMCNLGLSFNDLKEMKDPDHVFNFLKATFAAGIQVCDSSFDIFCTLALTTAVCVSQDSVQNVYQSDYVIHSVKVVSKEIAEANLQPLPGQEYAPGCNSCFYRRHVLPTGDVVYTQNNLLLSEDQRQIMTGRTLHNRVGVDDCETKSVQHMSTGKALNGIRMDVLSRCNDGTVPVLADGSVSLQGLLMHGAKAICLDERLWAGHSALEQQDFKEGVANILLRLAGDVQMDFAIGNAMAPSAGGATNADANLCGHEYIIATVPIHKEMPFDRMVMQVGAKLATGRDVMSSSAGRGSSVLKVSAVESTKWVNIQRAAADPKTCQLMNQISVLLKEVTKVPTVDPMDDVGENMMVVNLPLTTSDSMSPDKNGFYACVYVVGNKMVSHRISDTSGKYCKLVLGAPLSMVADNAKCLEWKPIAYNLLGSQMQGAGVEGVAGTHVMKLMDKCISHTAVPVWTKEQYQENVFDGYIPCGIHHEDKEALRLMRDGDESYVNMTFTHELKNGRIGLQADEKNGVRSVKEYVSSILSVLHDGDAPGITEVHAKRIPTVPPYVGMDMAGLKLKTFDHNKVFFIFWGRRTASCHALSAQNLTLCKKKVNEGIRGKLKGLIRVARISSQMGCVTTTCIARKSDLPKICDVLMNWAKPIVAAQQMKAQAGLQWRTRLESGGGKL